jgi:NADH dehydrogenase [ubiquinone] 1 alpha subcomplex assembly factor 7
MEINSLNNIRYEIGTKGFITISEFMEIVVSDEKVGYYSTIQPFGADGDFITSPEISQLFGEMLGIWVATIWEKLGKPSNIALVELGPGRGVLMADILRATKHIPKFHASINVHMVEKSRALKEIQSQQLYEYDNIKFKWYDSILELPKKPSILIANEFFDALPINQYIKYKNDWHEQVITIMPENGELCFSTIPVARVMQDFLDNEHPNAQNRSVVEIGKKSIDYIKHITSIIQKYKGAAIIVDYGYDYNNGERKIYNSTLQAIKNHRYHPVLLDVGKADISAHVDFNSLKQAVMVRGCQAYGAITQGNLLSNLGIKYRAEQLIKNNKDSEHIVIKGMKRLIDEDTMGNLFKAIAITHPSVGVPICF